MSRRRTAVAGQFYPGNESSLIRKIEDAFKDETFGPGRLPELKNKEKRTIIGGTAPHAGYDYSAPAAAWTYLNIFEEKMPDTVIILGTDHVGYNKIALMDKGAWDTPIGELEIDSEVADRILSNSDIIIADDSAFIGFPFGREHNIEVQLPFIKYFAKQKDVKIIPIKLTTKNFGKLDKIATDLASSMKELDQDIIIIASSDMTHKQPRNPSNPQQDLEQMRKQDQAVINAFKEFDPKKTLEYAQKTSVCGPQTITTLMLTCKKLGGTRTKPLTYYTSYEKMGGQGPCDYSVGYFSGIILTD
ncbi:MAG: hypothetical protein BAJALOKI3v1_720003 [Promethearchaeota archaeon]|nr:MAG: hypothetical protein BAJALOKI3v1_720003 [Candidatus Lokiarchaeota archaeon]